MASVTSLVGIAPAAWSHSQPRPVSGIVSAGAAIPTGSFKDHHDVGFHVDVSALVRLAGQGLRLRPEVSIARFSFAGPVGVIVPLNVTPSDGAMARTA